MLSGINTNYLTKHPHQPVKVPNVEPTLSIKSIGDDYGLTDRVY